MTAGIDYPLTTAALYEHLKVRLSGVVPEFELLAKAEIAVEINRLKKEKNAIILGHNYMEPALFHSVPDYTGDSLYLSRVSAQTRAHMIVFCGVRFMAETAKILNPSRTVLLPSAKGGCSLAASITAEDVRRIKAKYSGLPVVTYVNCYADVKAESDYCCTSGNAAEVVEKLRQLGHEQIAFLPDEYLARNTAHQIDMPVVIEDLGTLDQPVHTNWKAGQPLMVGWRGRCEVHEQFTVEDITNARKQFPGVVVLAHPECSPDVIKASDFSGSTTQMLRHVEQTEKGRLLLLTECSMGDNIAAQNPNREILRTCSIRCPHMGEITLEETWEALKQVRYVIDVPSDISVRAHQALQRMISIG